MRNINRVIKILHFQITINDTEKLTIQDSFTLSDEVIKTQVNETDQVTMQLISKDSSGQVELQYMGTKVSLKAV